MPPLQPRNWTSLPEVIPVREGIGFLVNYIDIKRQGLAWLCSLSGEFMEEKKEGIQPSSPEYPSSRYQPLIPRMPYQMNDVHITTDNLRQLLSEIYYSLRREQKQNSEPKQKKRIGFI